MAPVQRSRFSRSSTSWERTIRLLLVKVPEIAPWSDDLAWPSGCTVFVPFQDPENVGAVIRSAAAFGAARLVLLREAAHPFLPRASRAAGPALFQVPLQTGPSLAELGVEKAPLIALDMTGPDVDEKPFPERFGLVVGTEGRGLPEALASGRAKADPDRGGRGVAERGDRGGDCTLRVGSTTSARVMPQRRL